MLAQLSVLTVIRLSPPPGGPSGHAPVAGEYGGLAADDTAELTACTRYDTDPQEHLVTIMKPDHDRILSRSTPESMSTPEKPRVGAGLWLGVLALLPIVCCGLPLLLVAGAAAGTGALLGGAAGVVLVVAAVVLAVVTLLRRRTSACRTGTTAAQSRTGC